MLLHCHRFALDKTRSQNLGQNNRSRMSTILTITCTKIQICYGINWQTKKMMLQHSFRPWHLVDFWSDSRLLSLVFSLLPPLPTINQLITDIKSPIQTGICGISVQLLVPDLSNTELFFVGKYLHGISPLKLKGNKISMKRSVFPDVQFRPLNWTRLNRNKSN